MHVTFRHHLLPSAFGFAHAAFLVVSQYSASQLVDPVCALSMVPQQAMHVMNGHHKRQTLQHDTC